MRRALGILGVLVLAVAVVVAGVVGIGLLAGDETDPAETVDKPELAEATIIRTDLIESEEFEGELRFAEPRTVIGQLAGTVTGLAEPGSTLVLGDMAVEVDGAPVVCFYGSRPSWRALSEGVDDGADVLQLEDNLVALGYAARAELDGFTPDATFDADTAAMVELWREDLGLSEGSSVEFGRIVYVDGSVRVGETTLTVGAATGPGTPLFVVSSIVQHVVVQLPVDRRDLAAVGSAVVVGLRDDAVTSGVIESVSDLVTSLGAGPDAPQVVDVTIVLDDPDAVGGLDRAPVTVELESSRVEGALAVPVDALLALADGGYGLEIVEGDTVRRVGVEIGVFVDSLVEVTGDIAEGQTIRIPR